MSSQKSNNHNPKNENKSGFFASAKHRSYLYTAGFLVIVLILFIMNNSDGSSKEGPLPPNYVEASGKMLSLSSYSGKVVILDFWATWCPPCRKGIPDLIELKKKYKDKIEIIGLSVDEMSRNTKSKVVPFIKEYGINYPIVYADMKVVQGYGGINSIPTSFIIDTKGNIVQKHVGLAPKQTLEEEINKALKNGKFKYSVKAPDFSLPLAE